jgi:hypothetical protein
MLRDANSIMARSFKIAVAKIRPSTCLDKHALYDRHVSLELFSSLAIVIVPFLTTTS